MKENAFKGVFHMQNYSRNSDRDLQRPPGLTTGEGAPVYDTGNSITVGTGWFCAFRGCEFY